MPTCYNCKLKILRKKDLFNHLKLVYNHNLTSTSVYKCAEFNCNRCFSSLNSYKKHLTRHNLKENDYCNIVATIDTCEENDASSEVNCSYLSQERTYRSDESEFFKFKELLNNNTLTFISKLYADNTMTRKHVEIIIKDVSNLLKEPISLLKSKFDLMATKYPEFDGHMKYISELENLFDHLTTEYIRFKEFDSHNFFVKPVEYVVGQRLDNIQRGAALPKNYCYQFIPIRKVLKYFFELPNVLNRTLAYINEFKNDSKVYNIIQTVFWKKKVKFLNHSPDDIVLPLFIYFDEFESGYLLGSHANIHKIVAVYCAVPVLP